MQRSTSLLSVIFVMLATALGGVAALAEEQVSGAIDSPDTPAAERPAEPASPDEGLLGCSGEDLAGEAARVDSDFANLFMSPIVLAAGSCDPCNPPTCSSGSSCSDDSDCGCGGMCAPNGCVCPICPPPVNPDECPRQGKRCSVDADCRDGSEECELCRCFGGRVCGCP